MSKKEQPVGISRRTLVKSTAIGSLALAIIRCAPVYAVALSVDALIIPID